MALIKRLVDAGTNVEGRQERSNASALGGENDRVAAIRCLVSECKANVEASEKNGETPLHWAAILEDKVAAIRCLVSECKANVEAAISAVTRLCTDVWFLEPIWSGSSTIEIIEPANRSFECRRRFSHERTPRTIIKMSRSAVSFEY